MRKKIMRVLLIALLSLCLVGFSECETEEWNATEQDSKINALRPEPIKVLSDALGF